jgi:hypothetical protein
MTHNQRLVLGWLKEHCNSAGVVRVGSPEIGLIFGWSHQYTRKILSSLVSAGHLEELQKGTGRRPTKYRVTSASCNQMDVAATNSQSRSSTPKNVAHHVPRSNQKPSLEASGKKYLPFRYINSNRNNNTQQDNVQTKAHIRNIFENVAVDIYKPVRLRSSPFKRFTTHWDRVKKWNGPDFVCYFSYVYRVRWGESPTIEWRKDVGAARTLLKRIGDPLAFKVFIQVGMSLCRRKPDGLHTFSYGRFYQDVKEVCSGDIPEEILDEYDDECVFPWLRQEMLRRSREAATEYQRHLTKVYLGF